MQVEGRTYRGELIIQGTGLGLLSVINAVDLEAYVASVVGGEIYQSWPPAALEAQAVAARSYALSRTGNPAHPEYDVKAGEEDQVYRGIETEAPSTLAAAEATRGVVLTYQGHTISAYYSACDGGYTSDGSGLEDPQPYLLAAPDAYCPMSPYLHWSANVPVDEFTAALRAKFPDIGKLRGIRLGRADSSGRVSTVNVYGSKGSLNIPASDFRLLAGAHRVKSARITQLILRGDTIFLRGSGFGHGVGMCQYGAYGMAQAGFPTAAILEFYYPGSRLAYLNSR